MKDVDYDRYGKQASTGLAAFLEAIGSILMFCLKVFVKFIGAILILVGASTLIGLFVALFSVGTFNIIDAPWTDYVEMANIGAPLWLMSLLVFFAVGIPFFFLFYLGLKILVKNLKSIGTTAKFILLGLWLASLIMLAVFGIRQATERALDADIVTTETVPITANDTLTLKMQNNLKYNKGYRRQNDFELMYDDDGNRILYSRDVRLIVKSTQDSIASIQILKNAEGSEYNDAKRYASNINYNYTFNNNVLALDSYLTTGTENKYHDQQVEVTMFLPVGTTLYADKNTYDYHSNDSWRGDILDHGQEEHYLIVEKDKMLCETCPVDTNDDDWDTDDENWDNDDDEFNAKINSNGEEFNVKINENGIEVNNEKVNSLRINGDGIEINSRSDDN